MTQRFLLRAEAVNLASFVYDTARLPTVRGGGLLLLRAPKAILDWLEKKEGVSKIEALRAGASAGVFAFDAQAGDGEAIRDALEGWLGGDEKLRHATFVVDVVESTKDYQHDLEKLVARNHFRQLRSPSVAYPAQAGVVPCAVDGIRPGTEHGYLPGEDKANVSTSVKLRTEYGREQKQAFYREEAGVALDPVAFAALKDTPFARDFHDLADDRCEVKLDGKMAVLYFDGNGFGALQQKLCKTSDQAREFDEYLQEKKRQLLASLLAAMHAQPQGWLFRGQWKQFLRFETLLWGGDEFLFVVPAWKGWWLLGEIYERMAEWKFGSMPLTFAAGLVLCSAKAPIRRMKALAQTLAEEAKAVSRTQSFAAYQVLESFDLVPGNFEEFRNRRSAGHDRQQMLVAGDQVKNLARAIEGLKPLLPRKRLYRLTEAILKRPGELEECRTNLRGATAAPKQQADELWKALRGASQSEAAGQLHLTELWDYIESITPAKEVALAG